MIYNNCSFYSIWVIYLTGLILINLKSVGDLSRSAREPGNVVDRWVDITSLKEH